MGDGKKNEKTEKARRDSFRKVILNNFGLKFLSIAVAIIIWMMIINIDDPVKERVFTVPVQTINEKALKSVNKVYEIVDGSTATVRVRGKKSIIYRLDASDIKATADLSNLSSVNAVDINTTLKRHFASDPELICNQVMKVSLEDMESKQVKVTVITKGEPADGYSVGECVAKPSMIEVSGGKSAVDQINMVRVFLNVNGANRDFMNTLTPVAYDESGKKVQSSTLQYGVSKVDVNATILRTKIVPVHVEVKGKTDGDYQFEKAECMPEKVEIAGKDGYLNNLDSLTVPIDIANTKQSVRNYNVELSSLYPNLIISKEFSTVSVRAHFKKMEKIKKIVKLDDVKLYSVSGGCDVEIIDKRSKVTVTLRKSGNTDDYSSASEIFYVDCKNLQPGVYRLPIKLELDGQCTLVQTKKILVKISSKNSEPIASEDPQNKDTAEKDDSSGKKEESEDKTTPTETAMPIATEKDSEGND